RRDWRNSSDRLANAPGQGHSVIAWLRFQLRNDQTSASRLLALLGPREMSDLSPQSGPKRTLITVFPFTSVIQKIALTAIVDQAEGPGLNLLRPLDKAIRQDQGRPSAFGQVTVRPTVALCDAALLKNLNDVVIAPQC